MRLEKFKRILPIKKRRQEKTSSRNRLFGFIGGHRPNSEQKTSNIGAKKNEKKTTVDKKIVFLRVTCKLVLFFVRSPFDRIRPVFSWVDQRELEIALFSRYSCRLISR